MAFPSVMLTAAVPAQAEWNGNDIMFIQERCSQTQISVSKMLGCSRTENTPETSRWISPGAHTAPLISHLSPSHAHSTTCLEDPHHPIQTDLHTYHTTYTPHTLPPYITQTHTNHATHHTHHTDTYQPHHTPHTSHRHIPTMPQTLPNTHHTDTYQHTPQWEHTHMHHTFTDTQTPRGVYRCTWSLPISV